MAISTVQRWRIYPRSNQIQVTSSKSVKPFAPMTALSTLSTRTAVRPALVLGISIFHGLIVAALFVGIQQPADHSASPTVAMIMAPVVKVAVPDQKPSPVVPATTIDTTPSDPPPDPTAMTQPPAPRPSTSVGAAELPPAAISAAVSRPTPSPGSSARPTDGDEIVPQVTRTASAPPMRADAPTRSHARPRLVEQHPPSSHGEARLVTASAKPTATYASRPAPSPVPAQSPAPTSAQAGSAASPQLIDRIRNAVQEAVRCPPAARMMGQSGKAGVAFDYRAGVIVGRAQLARSSGTPVLDAAALTAVRMAHYPEAQPEDSNQLLHLLIWVEEACGG
jgi:periplasmic protein TonB